MRFHHISSAVAVLAIALVLAPTADAASSLAGTRGLIRVHSADTHAPGYVAGTLTGLYARETYTAAESPRGVPETVKFGGGTLAFVYAPSSYVEFALRGAMDSQFVDSEPVAYSEQSYGISGVGFNFKALITPPSQKNYMLGGEFGLSSATGSLDAQVGSWDYEGMDITGQLNFTYQQIREDTGRAAMRLHTNAGYLTRTSEFDPLTSSFSEAGTPTRSRLHGNQLFYGVGLEMPVPQGWTLFTEWSGEYDMDSDQEYMDSAMRVTPGFRWSNPASSFTFTGAVEIAVSNEGSAPGWQLVTGMGFGGYVAAVNGMLRGLIRDAETGEPVPGVRVSVRNTTDVPATSDGDGRFQTELREGYAVLELAADGYNPKTRVVEIKGHDRVDFDFTLTKRNVFGGIRGRVRDAETGDPLFARVRVAGTDEWVESDPATGSFTLDHVTEGDTSLEIEARNYEAVAVVARVLAGDVTAQDVSLVRDRNAMIGLLSGQVRDGRTGMAVAAVVTARGNSTVTASVDATTGLYELELEGGTYNISVTSSGYIAEVKTVEIAAKQASVHNVDLRVLPKKMALKGVFFDSGTATIKRESFTVLEDAGQFLLENEGLQVVIEGHTDSTGSAELNMALSQRRADAVLKFLVVNYGVGPDRLDARGLGPQEPIASNASADGRALNRRIEFRIEENGAH